jgi:crossover junction endodeoxyribonuclease RusA
LPNARVHWARKAKDAKVARHVAAWFVREAGIRPGDFDVPYSVKVTLGFAPPDKRRRDLDGMLGAMKSSLDGIADAIGVDDSKFEIVIRRDVSVKGGAVHVTLEAA